jgi:hypothetical protein
MLDTLWLILTQSYFDITTRYLIGFLAAVGCFAITSWHSKYVGSNPRLFTVLALFAGVWVAIALMYEQTPWTSSGEAPKNSKAFRPNDVAGDLASFIMVFVGTLLSREGNDKNWFSYSQRLQIAAMVLLAALVLPHHVPTRFRITPEQWELAIAGALALVGFAALAVGAIVVSARLPVIIIGTLVIYGAFSTWRCAELILLPRTPQSDFMALSFAALKLILAFTFCRLVVQHAKNPVSES